MASIIAFELEDRSSGEMAERRFEAVGIGIEDLWSVLGDEQGVFFGFIEEIEQELGTIDQTGTQDPGGTGGDWTIGSSEVEDREAFVERVTAWIREHTGWTLVELP